MHPGWGLILNRHEGFCFNNMSINVDKNFPIYTWNIPEKSQEIPEVSINLCRNCSFILGCQGMAGVGSVWSKKLQNVGGRKNCNSATEGFPPTAVFFIKFHGNLKAHPPNAHPPQIIRAGVINHHCSLIVPYFLWSLALQELPLHSHEIVLYRKDIQKKRRSFRP